MKNQCSKYVGQNFFIAMIIFFYLKNTSFIEKSNPSPMDCFFNVDDLRAGLL